MKFFGHFFYKKPAFYNFATVIYRSIKIYRKAPRRKKKGKEKALLLHYFLSNGFFGGLIKSKYMLINCVLRDLKN